MTKTSLGTRWRLRVASTCGKYSMEKSSGVPNTTTTNASMYKLSSLSASVFTTSRSCCVSTRKLKSSSVIFKALQLFLHVYYGKVLQEDVTNGEICPLFSFTFGFQIMGYGRICSFEIPTKVIIR